MKYVLWPSFVFMVFGPASRVLIRANGKLTYADFYQGISMTLAAASTLISLHLDISKMIVPEKLEATRSLLASRQSAIHIFLSLYLMAGLAIAFLQQKHDRGSGGQCADCLKLAVSTDLIGIAMMASAIIFAKGL